MTQIPEIYRAGYEQAARLNPALAARYIRHTTAADPPADGVMQALTGYEQRQIHRCINAGMEQDDPVLRQAPAEVRHFFDQVSVPPDWYAPDVVHPGRRPLSPLFRPVYPRPFRSNHPKRRHPDPQSLLHHRPGSLAARPPAASAKTPAILSKLCHPRILNLSEFFSCNGLAAFNRRCRSGQWIWRLGSQQQARARLMLQGDFEEMLYTVNAPNARFTRDPPVMCAASPI